MYEKIYVPNPNFDSNLTKNITSLEKLRNEDNLLFGGFRQVGISIFLGLKDIFQTIESLASARIEGNRTTLSQFISSKKELPKDEKRQQKNKEIQNIYEAISFIDEFKKNGNEIKINHGFFSNLHAILMKDLKTEDGYEGDNTPGEYRKKNVMISKSTHIPPDYTQIQLLMDELIDFVENFKNGQPQYDLLKVAVIHHRFVWIHPYGNGNGRMVRVLTYALLLKYGFDIGNFGLLNPSTLFCLERNKYYDYLNQADSGEESSLLQWCDYAIEGINNEVQKLELLGKKDFVINKILFNALSHIKGLKIIDQYEEAILRYLYLEGKVEAKDIKKFLKLHPVTISVKLRHLKSIELISSKSGKKTSYGPTFKNNEIFKAIFYELANNGFDSWLNLDKIEN